MRKLILLTIIVNGLISCSEQNNNLKKYNSTFDIGEISGIENFRKLQNIEMQMDEPFSNEDIYPFRKNRSRMFLDFFRNERIQEKDSIYKKGLPTRCQCFTENDTTFVKMGIGFFGGFGLSIKIHNNKFESSFYEYTDDTKPFKSDYSEKKFSNNVIVQNKYQSLILDTKPTKEEQLTGFMTFTTNKYYSKTNQILDTLFVKGKIYFTCEIKEK